MSRTTLSLAYIWTLSPHPKHSNIAVCLCSIATASHLQEKYTRIHDDIPRNQLYQHVQFSAKIPVWGNGNVIARKTLCCGLLRISLFCCSINILTVLSFITMVQKLAATRTTRKVGPKLVFMMSLRSTRMPGIFAGCEKNYKSRRTKLQAESYHLWDVTLKNPPLTLVKCGGFPLGC
jgi:hypothetical protein